MGRGERSSQVGAAPRRGDSLQSRYSYGQCLALAIALQERSGGQLIGLGCDRDELDQRYQQLDQDHPDGNYSDPFSDWEEKPVFDHFGVELDDGRVIDAQGIYSSSENFADMHNYAGLVGNISADEALAAVESNFPEQDLDRARQDVDKVAGLVGFSLGAKADLTLDQVISQSFGMSRAESRRLIAQGGVRREDGRPVGQGEEIKDGERIRIGRQAAKTISYNNPPTNGQEGRPA